MLIPNPIPIPNGTPMPNAPNGNIAMEGIAGREMPKLLPPGRAGCADVALFVPPDADAAAPPPTALLLGTMLVLSPPMTGMFKNTGPEEAVDDAEARAEEGSDGGRGGGREGRRGGGSAGGVTGAAAALAGVRGLAAEAADC